MCDIVLMLICLVDMPRALLVLLCLACAAHHTAGAVGVSEQIPVCRQRLCDACVA
jgi:hypothetical protein